MRDLQYPLLFLVLLPLWWNCSSGTKSPQEMTAEERMEMSKAIVEDFQALELPYFFDTGLLTAQRVGELELLSPAHRDFMEVALGYDIDDPETQGMRNALELRKVGRLDLGEGMELLILVDQKAGTPRGNRVVSVVNGRISSQIFPLSVRTQGRKFMEITAERQIRFSGSGGKERLYRVFPDGLFEHVDLESMASDSLSVVE